MAGTFMKGIHVIFHPVQSMLVNQITKFTEGSDEYWVIIGVNLDKVEDTSVVQDRIINNLESLLTQTTSTYFLFCSTPSMAKHSPFAESLIQLAHKGILQSNTIDEAHLWGKYGASFRSNIRKVEEKYLAPLYKRKNLDDCLF